MSEAHISRTVLAAPAEAEPGLELVHGLGVYYRRFFADSVGCFRRVQEEHTFQTLTESTKPGKAHRTGIYLTPVRRVRDVDHFRLLRCSTNLSGPTENFRATDRYIVDALNQAVARVFEGAAPLNHVLAQLYHNTPADAEKKQTKAKISPHADKTKDMPVGGLLAFCTFYERDESDERALTRLRFRWKGGGPGDFPAEFTVTLHPGSVFIVPLSTNRLYTHAIVPSELDAARVPTRLGYVVRCSNAEAIHADGRTFLVKHGERIPLDPPSEDAMQDLRARYAEENTSSARVAYEDRFRFSMNAGDYQAPGYAPADELRVYALDTRENLFGDLLASAPLEEVGSGRRGAVLVVEGPRGVPIVRTTTSYALTAQVFTSVHTRLAERIAARASVALAFNNALLEVYTQAYTTMGAHSDQGLDLDEATEIALYSCYERSEAPNRRLVVEPKEGGPSFSIPLEHDTVVVFSWDTNRRFRHRIIRDAPAGRDNPWLGMTFRTSRTFVSHDDVPRVDGVPLTLATEEERRTFYALRGLENREVDFRYPALGFTLSASDLLLPNRAVGGRAIPPQVSPASP